MLGKFALIYARIYQTMFGISVGDKLPDASQEGMRVTPGPHGLAVEVICDQESAFAGAVREGAPFQLAFFDAKPFGWFLLNAGQAGWFDCCWAISALPADLVEMMRSCFRQMKEQNKANSWDKGFPAILALADRTGTVFEVMPLEMDENSWHLLAKTYLSHPTATDERELSKQRARFERRYQKLDDFHVGRAVWIQNYNPVVSQLGTDARLN